MKKTEKQQTEKSQEKKEARKLQEKHLEAATIIRILSKDIDGGKKLFSGIMAIKGVSWAFSNALCKKLNLDKNKRIQDLTKEEIGKIEKFMHNPELPVFLLNRRKDLDTGDNKHLYGADLDLQREFDIKKMKKIKCFKGIRHSLGQPVRGQNTRSHFRRNRKNTGATGIKKKKEVKAKQ